MGSFLQICLPKERPLRVNVGLSGWLEGGERPKGFLSSASTLKRTERFLGLFPLLWAASGRNPAPGFMSKKPLS